MPFNALLYFNIGGSVKLLRECEQIFVLDLFFVFLGCHVHFGAKGIIFKCGKCTYLFIMALVFIMFFLKKFLQNLKNIILMTMQFRFLFFVF